MVIQSWLVRILPMLLSASTIKLENTQDRFVIENILEAMRVCPHHDVATDRRIHSPKSFLVSPNSLIKVDTAAPLGLLM